MNTLLPILHKLVEYLGYKDVVKSGLKEVWDTFNEWLQEKYGGWKKILKKAFDVSIEAALSALKAVKEEIIKVCKENHKILEQLTKFATKACLGPLIMKQALKAGAKISAREGTKQAAKMAARQGTKGAVKGGAKSVGKTILKEGTRQATKRGSKMVIKQTVRTATKEGAKQTLKQGSKTATSQAIKSAIKSGATPLSIGSDVAQAGFEWFGYKKIGKTVGVTGNITAGAIVGSVAGPPGAALGALGGFLVWGAGEVVGGLVDRAFGTDNGTATTESKLILCTKISPIAVKVTIIASI